MNKDVYHAIENRRSFYAIGNEPIVDDNKIIEIIRHAVKYVPSAYNSQSARLAILLKKEHEQLWEMTWEILRPKLSEKAYSKTQEKLSAFQKGYGTILYFEEQATVQDLQERFPLYEDSFPVWSLQSSGMLQYAIWVLLESEGYGASLQHYNPLIDEKVRLTWNIPENWKLLAQMPFGKPYDMPREKTFLPLEERIMVMNNDPL